MPILSVIGLAPSTWARSVAPQPQTLGNASSAGGPTVCQISAWSNQPFWIYCKRNNFDTLQPSTWHVPCRSHVCTSKLKVMKYSVEGLGSPKDCFSTGCTVAEIYVSQNRFRADRGEPTSPEWVLDWGDFTKNIVVVQNGKGQIGQHHKHNAYAI